MIGDADAADRDRAGLLRHRMALLALLRHVAAERGNTLPSPASATPAPDDGAAGARDAMTREHSTVVVLPTGAARGRAPSAPGPRPGPMDREGATHG